MQLIKNRRLSTQDDWGKITDNPPPTELPQGKIIVSGQYWLEHRNSLKQSSQPLGLALSGADDLEDYAADLDAFALIALDFPSFRDGRAYSMARRLRAHHQYSGEIRATGNVLRDQLGYMERVGFNSFELPDDQNAQEALKSFNEISINYQASSDQNQPLYRHQTR